jgi:hypothetical protein
MERWLRFVAMVIRGKFNVWGDRIKSKNQNANNQPGRWDDEKGAQEDDVERRCNNRLTQWDDERAMQWEVMRWWFVFDHSAVNFEARLWDIYISKTVHRHEDWTLVHRRHSGGREEEEERRQRQCNNQPEQWDEKRTEWWEATQQPASVMRGQEGGTMRGWEGNTIRGDATTSWRDEKPRRRRNKRTTRGNATSSRGNMATRRGCNKRMSRGDATTS